jgi:hypothetical protein
MFSPARLGPYTRSGPPTCVPRVFSFGTHGEVEVAAKRSGRVAPADGHEAEARVDHWGEVPVESVEELSALGGGVHVAAPLFAFRALLWELEEARVAGTPVTLSGRRLAAAALAARTALWVEEEIKPREDHALAALDSGAPYNERHRTYAHRMLGRPDRAEGGRAATYPPAVILRDYSVLSGQARQPSERDIREVAALYRSRQLLGLRPGRCSRHTQPASECLRCWPPITLPLSRHDAVTAMEKLHGFPNWDACFEAIKRARREIPATDRPKLPNKGFWGVL